MSQPPPSVVPPHRRRAAPSTPTGSEQSVSQPPAQQGQPTAAPAGSLAAPPGAQWSPSHESAAAITTNDPAIPVGWAAGDANASSSQDHWNDGTPAPVDVFGRPLARWGQRAVALIIDLVLFAFPGALLLFVVIGTQRLTVGNPDTGQLHVVTHYPPAFWIVVGCVPVAQLVYFTVLGGAPRGQTVGMSAVHIAIRDPLTGDSIRHSRAFLRAFIMLLLLAVYGVPFAIDCLWPLIEPQRRSFHDMAARSIVVEV